MDGRGFQPKAEGEPVQGDDLATRADTFQPQPKPGPFLRLPQWLRRPADHDWSYWAIHLAIAFLATIPVAGITYYFIQKLYPKTPFQVAWHGILGSERSVQIIVADVPEQKLEIPPYGKTNLPKNVPLVGLAESWGISELREALSLGGITQDFCAENTCGPEQRKRVFVTVGGPSINGETRGLVANWNESKNRFESDETVELDGQLVIYYPSHHVVDFSHPDEKDPQKPSIFNPDDGTREPLTKDYGFIVIGANRRAKDQILCVALFGVWPPGTQAAIQALVEPGIKGKEGELLEKLRKGEPLVAVIETTVGRNSFTSEGPKILYVRDLKRERVSSETAKQYATAYTESRN